MTDKLKQVAEALGGLLSTIRHERKTGLCQGSEWVRVIDKADEALTTLRELENKVLVDEEVYREFMIYKAELDDEKKSALETLKERVAEIEDLTAAEGGSE